MKSKYITCACFLSFTTSLAIAADPFIMPQSAFFGGLGGGWSRARSSKSWLTP